MTRLTGTLLTLCVAAPATAGDVGFVEDFALARDRAAALKQLIPGTEDYYYYHALHYLNTEQYEKAEQLTGPWHQRFSQTPRLTEVQTRHALLTYDRNPQKSLDYLRGRLGVHFDHQREVVGVAPGLPTALDTNLISRATLLTHSKTHWSNLDNFEDSALDWLAAEALDPDRRRNLLQRLMRSDIVTLPQLVAADLSHPNGPGFGGFAVHRLMTLPQLADLLKLRPELLNQTAFVQAWLSKLQPGADEDWKHTPARARAFLDRMLEFVRKLNPSHNSLKAHVLYHRLAFDRAQGQFDKALFLEYLALPRPQAYISKALAESDAVRNTPADLNADFGPHTLMPPVGADEVLVRAYLKQFFVAADSPKEFEPWVNDVYLRHLFAETKIELGLGEPERWASDLPPELYRAVKDRTDIDFAATNKTSFAADEPVRLDLFVKNVPTLLVKVFEINTVNYYRDQRREIDTDVNLDGLVANAEQTHTYADAPVRRIPRRFEFPTLTRPGVYVIDFIGAGKSSRALVRKGRLRAVASPSTAGHAVTVVDENRRPVPDAAVSLGGKEYTPGADGVTLVPFSTSPGRQPIVLRRGEFASLDYLDHRAEQYQLVAGIHVERESLLSQRVAPVLIRPGVYLNGASVSVRVLEQPKLRITATDHDGIVTTSEVPDVRLFEDRETVHELRVPPRLASLQIALTAKVRSLVTNQLIDVAAGEGFALNAIARTDKIEDLHLAKFGPDYAVELLGRTGEAKPDRAVQFALKHRDFKQPVNAALKTDARGRVVLGPLTDIVSVTATGPDGVTHTWPLPRDEAVVGRVLHARAGEVVSVPYPVAGNAVTREDVALFEVVGEETRVLVAYTVARPDGTQGTAVNYAGAVKQDRFDAVAAADGQLELRNLTAGDYDLWLKRTGERVRVRVSDGPAAAGHVLGAGRYLELPQLQPVRIASVTADDKAVTVRLKGVSPFARVHVFATRYVPAYPAFDQLSKVQDAELTTTTLGYADSVYLTGRNIGDEYRYVLDRKYQKKYPGNMLDRPQLLLNPWAVRATDTGEQVAEGGESFGGVGGATAPKSGASLGGGGGIGASIASTAMTAYPDLDFLAESAAVVANLVPDKDGVVTVDRKALGGHGFVHVVAVDPLHTVTRTLALPEQPTKYLDLRLAAGLDPKGHFTQQKQVTVLAAGKPFVMADAAGGRFEAYDSLARVYALYSTLSSNDPKLAEFAFVLDWPKLKPERKQELYSKHACHELSFFLMKKDPEFFARVVKPYLANKKDKTFFDQWLLGADVGEYLSAWRYGRLNTVERVLLARRLAGEQPKTARHLSDLLKLLPPAPDRDRVLFETGMMGRGLDSKNSSYGLSLPPLAMKPSDPRSGGSEAKPAADAPAAAAPPLPTPAGPGGGGGFGGGNMPGPSGRPAGGERAGDDTGKSRARDGAARRSESLERKKAKADDKALGSDEVDLRQGMNEAERQGPATFFGDDRRKAGASLPPVLFRKVDPTQEWAENNYYKLPIAQQVAALVPVSPFWVDYANHDDKSPFLSPHLAAASRNFTEMMFALAVLDLPFEAGKHEVKFDAGAMTFTPAGPAVAFHEQVRPVGEPGGRVPVLVSQNFYRHGDRYRDENGERLDKFVTGEFVAQTVYGCQVVVTNPGPSPQRLSVLVQVPVGAVAVNGRPTRTVLLALNPYQTQTVDYLFYFPRAGRFAHFPAHVAKNEQPVAAAAPAVFDVVETPTKLDTGSWDYVSQNGTPEQVVEYLNRENVHALNLDRIAFRMRDRDFFEKVVALLDGRHAYQPTLWGYALLHNAVPAAKQYLLHADALVAEAGGPLDVPLLAIDPVARHTYEHLEYKPLVNARAHALGQRRQIVNDRLHAQYHAFLKALSYRRALTDDDELAAAHYLLLQDRIEEATAAFGRVNPDRVATRLQYDYCAAYLAMFDDDPRRARDIASRHANHPVDRWRNAFAAVLNQLDEVEGKAARVADAEDRDQRQGQAATAEPTFDAAVEGRAVTVTWQNVESVRVNYYLMDVELLFSRNPFVQASGGQFAFIRPNATKDVPLPKGQSKLSVPLPDELVKRNVLVEVTAGGKTRAVAYYATAMDVKLTEGYGHVRATDATSGKPLAKVYVKCYARTADGAVKFYKDGYTDHRGRFDYASVSTPEKSPPVRFAVLVLSDEYGATIREAAPPQQ